jgi:Uma2 family endonuclease
MAAEAEPLLMTVEQYRQLPDTEDVIQELHWGMVVTLTRPKMRHAKLQSRLVRLLRPKAEHLGVVETEVAFRALPEYDLRGADVAFVSQQRWDNTGDDDNLHGSPELVIEVLSPSNTRAEIHEKAVLCLSSGTQKFWVVDPKRKTVSVTGQGGVTTVYRMGDSIPLEMFQGRLEVSEVFGVTSPA